MLPGPCGAGLGSWPGRGHPGAAFLSPSRRWGRARLTGSWLSAGVCSCAAAAQAPSWAWMWVCWAGDPRVSVPFPLWLSSDFLLQLLAFGKLLFRISLWAQTSMCLQPKQGPPRAWLATEPRSPVQGPFPFGRRYSCSPEKWGRNCLQASWEVSTFAA